MASTKRTSKRRLSFANQSEQRQCGLCFDGRDTLKLSSPSQWKNQDAKVYVLSIDPSVLYVCQACRQDVTKVLSNDTYIPRWQKLAEKESKTCCVNTCDGKVFASLNKVTTTDINRAFSQCELQSIEPIPIPTSLCKHHYHIVYNTMHPTQTHCVTCGSSLRHTTPKTCTHPSVIEQHLRERADFNGTIKEGDKVCYVCYRSHLVIIDRRDKEDNSIDSDLNQLIQRIQDSIDVSQVSMSEDEMINLCMKRVTVTVGKELLQRNAILLPTAHDIFSTYLSTSAQIEHVTIHRKVSSAWILSNLTVSLGKHMSYTCTTRKFGTIIYRSKSDLIPALSHALWRIRNMSKSTKDTDTSDTINKTSLQIDVLDQINERAHSCIKTLLSGYTEHPYEHDSLDIDKTIQQIDPIVWEAVCKLTRTQNEKRGRAHKLSSLSHHIKKVRRLYLLSVLFYCINDRCSMPFHTLITDMVEGQGGSALLIKILNRLGVCSSADTLSRFIQYKVSSLESQPIPFTNPESFTVVSADNIDFMHSYARVNMGKQNSSWHGTSIQIVQPLPSLAIQKEMETVENVTVLSEITNREMDTSSHADITSKERTSSYNWGIQHTAICFLPSSEGSNDIHLGTTLKSARRSSPVHSPLKITRSPAAKLLRRFRTGTEQNPVSARTINSSQTSIFAKGDKPSAHKRIGHQTSLSDYRLNDMESSAFNELMEEIGGYMLGKVSLMSKEPDKLLLSLQDYLSILRPNHTEQSNVYYLRVMDAVADNKNTLMEMLHEIYCKYIKTKIHLHVVVEGDAKLYSLLQSLKYEYAEDLEWVIPYPGDWHMLMNYQAAIMKPYFGAGLKSMAESAGYPVAAIQSCSQFKRTHNFILEAWEAVYRAMLIKYLDTQPIGNTSLNTQTQTSTGDQLQDRITQELLALHQTNEKDKCFSASFHATISTINSLIEPVYEGFKHFLQNMASRDDTWKTWVQFVFTDAMAYVALFLSIRSGDWQVRMASMKMMAPIFTAYDHPTYQKLISDHISDVLNSPESVLLMFKQGAFVININGRPWHSVGIDEGHEMLINKQCKTSIVKPTEDYINRVAKYISYRTKALQTTTQQLLPEMSKEPTEPTNIFSVKPTDKKFEQNVRTQTVAVQSSSLLDIPEKNRGLFNPFTNVHASQAQSHDLLNFRKIGEEEFLLAVCYYILKEPSVKAPNRRRSLKTFSEKEPKTRKISQLERDKTLILSTIKKKIQHSLKTGKPISEPGEQVLEYPISLCDNIGNPLKGQKSYFTKSLHTRYNEANPPVITNDLPADWKPECCILEGMFMINTTPLGCHTTVSDYSKFLLRRYVAPQLSKGINEIHIIFDNPGRLHNTPKFFEQKRRDTHATISTSHRCDEITGATKVTRGKWRETLLNCRECKRKLVKYLGMYFLKNCSSYLQAHQTVYIAGAFDGDITDTAWFVRGKSPKQPDPRYTCNAEETDTRIWLHATKTPYKCILIMSPDTDIYNIGLPLSLVRNKKVAIQVSTYNSRELKFVLLNNLVIALSNDPDLARINPALLPYILQIIYICTGCDYLSFFSQIGKATFLRYFFQYASFITSGSEAHPGTLADTGLTDGSYRRGYLAFVRLVGVTYFKKFASGFGTTSPSAYFTTCVEKDNTPEQQHSIWLRSIRNIIWFRTKFENEMVASDEALMLHWKRTCWVANMWNQADQNQMLLQPMTDWGWEITNETLKVVWDSVENVKSIQDRVCTLTKGCKCKTGCTTKRCTCNKNGKICSVGCECINCSNVHVHVTYSVVQETSSQLRDVAIEEEHMDQHSDIEDLMDFVFGQDQDLEGNLSDSDSDSET